MGNCHFNSNTYFNKGYKQRIGILVICLCISHIWPCSCQFLGLYVKGCLIQNVDMSTNRHVHMQNCLHACMPPSVNDDMTKQLTRVICNDADVTKKSCQIFKIQS